MTSGTEHRHTWDSARLHEQRPARSMLYAWCHQNFSTSLVDHTTKTTELLLNLLWSWECEHEYLTVFIPIAFPMLFDFLCFHRRHQIGEGFYFRIQGEDVLQKQSTSLHVRSFDRQCCFYSTRQNVIWEYSQCLSMNWTLADEFGPTSTVGLKLSQPTSVSVRALNQETNQRFDESKQTDMINQHRKLSSDR